MIWKIITWGDELVTLCRDTNAPSFTEDERKPLNCGKFSIVIEHLENPSTPSTRPREPIDVDGQIIHGATLSGWKESFSIMPGPSSRRSGPAVKVGEADWGFFEIRASNGKFARWHPG